MTSSINAANVLSRRSFLQASVAAGSAISFASPALLGSTSPDQDPDHFFLHIYFPGALDSAYTFDARSKDMVAAKLQQNFLPQAPTKWLGSNGGEALVSEYGDLLKPYFDRFSIVNGSVMLTNFNGHGENTNYMLSGNAFGGEGFHPHLNSSALVPLDVVQLGSPSEFSALTNYSNSVPLSPKAAQLLVLRMREMGAFSGDVPALNYARQRFAANANGESKLGVASFLMGKTFDKSKALYEAISALDLANATADADQSNLNLLKAVFAKKISRTAFLSFESAVGPVTVDCHGLESAQGYPTLVQNFMTRLAGIFKYMRDTAYDDKRSLFDVTTILVSSEMGRTLRTSFGPADRAGTDHNPLSNSVLVGGKGIKGGLILGSADSQTPTEVISNAHVALDRDKVSAMGRPFDYETGLSRTDLPNEYKHDDYLNYLSVVNTIYSVFGVPADRHMSPNKTNTKPSRVLTQLLA